MKKLLLCLGMSALLFTGCSDDDDNGLNVNANDLMKKWYQVSYVVGGETFPYDDHEACGLDYIEFLPNGIMNEVDVWDCTTYTDTYGWSLSGDRLTLIYDVDDRETVTITKITDTELHVKVKYDFDDDGDEETITQKLTSVPLENI
ncbi:MAG: lipocalin family protein [Flavobacterium sp.]|nr:lipocalin family protein [Flavobacterium sp.]